MITIKQRGKAWRLLISEEEWEYKGLKELKIALEKILKMKEDNGHINSNAVATYTKTYIQK